MDYSQTVVLRFSANQKTIDGYAKQFEELATETGTANKMNVNSGWCIVGDEGIKDLPEDYTVYVIINQGSPNGKCCVVSISQERNNIIFYAQEFIW